MPVTDEDLMNERFEPKQSPREEEDPHISWEAPRLEIHQPANEKDDRLNGYAKYITPIPR